jgi:diguanylate cyclase (GGDEF)-like protein
MDALKELNQEASPSAGNEALRQVADRLSRSLAAEDQIARVGSDEFAVLASTATLEEASELSARLEWVLSSQGTKATFGWAIHPQEGENALALLSRRERAALRAQGDARLPPHGACSREAPRGLAEDT